MKICIVTSRFPYPIEKGDKLRVYHQIRKLSKAHELSLISICDTEPNPSDLSKLKEFCKEIYTFKISKMQSISALFQALFHSKPFQVAYFYNKGHHKKITSIINNIQPDHIFCQLVRVCEYVKELPTQKTLDYMDAFSKGMQRRAVRARFLRSIMYKSEARRLEKYETDVFDYFNHHCVISRQDAEELTHSSKIKVIPNGVNTEYFKAINDEKEYDIGFIGNLGYTPNIEAVHYIMDSIKPGLPKGSKILIAGARPPLSVSRYAGGNVDVVGWVEDIRDSYSKVKVFVAPLFHGIGQQNKILEAMSMGIPCVTNSMVNNAIGATDKRHILIADTPSEFVAAIEELLNNEELYQAIVRKARAFVAQNFSWEEQGRRLTALMKGEQYH